MEIRTERQKEEQHLAECLQVIKANIAAYEKDIAVMNADIQAMYESYHDNDPEIFTELSNTITMNEHMKTALSKNQRALIKPYFGRIDILNENKKEETFYLGKGGVMQDKTTILVVDWRAPIANVYYENGLGECSYPAPGNQMITIDLKRKRTYEIENERLVDFFDSEVVANDELLTKYLAKNKEAVLGEIIATIQKEQNDIIRKSPYRSMIVQGVAGSGKTTVAMHRISFILYNYEKEFRPDDFYIIGSNRILLNYITGVLPELDVHGVKQMTMEELFVRLLYEDWDEKKYRIAKHQDNAESRMTTAKKGTYDWFHKLEDFCDRLEENTIPQETVLLDGEVLYPAEQIRNYIREAKSVSIQSKINMLNERVLAKLRNEMTGRDISYAPEVRKQKIKEYTGLFGAKKWKRSIYDLYEEFLTEQDMSLRQPEQKKTSLDLYDLAALAYLYKRVKETDPIREAHHVVVDEAQDFGMMSYAVLKYCIPGATWTIMGDVSQNIRFGVGLNDWEELKGLMLTDKNDTFGVLSKSYRNTVEISEFAQKILRHGTYFSYPIEPIIRHGAPVGVEKAPDEETMLSLAAEKITEWQQEGYDTIAVVSRTAKEAEQVAKQLGKRIKIEESDLEKAEFKQGVLVLPVEYTKGLEFDAVLICNPTKEDYPEDDGHAKLLYVAATRALHELCVLHLGEATNLLKQ
ncbi:MAG: HelD family protein [Lachnospiraceae bacterium]